MGVLTHVRNIYIALTESADTYVNPEMTDKERDSILKQSKDYKELSKADSNISTREKIIVTPVNSGKKNTKKGGFVESVDVKDIKIPPKMRETYNRINDERID